MKIVRENAHRDARVWIISSSSKLQLQNYTISSVITGCCLFYFITNEVPDTGICAAAYSEYRSGQLIIIISFGCSSMFDFLSIAVQCRYWRAQQYTRSVYKVSYHLHL